MISDAVKKFSDKNRPENQFISVTELKTELEKNGFRECQGGHFIQFDNVALGVGTPRFGPKEKTLPILMMIVIDGKIAWPDSMVSDRKVNYVFVPAGSCIVYKPYIPTAKGEYSPEGFFEKYQKIIELPEPIKIISLDELFKRSLFDRDGRLIMFESELQTLKKLIEEA